jgi:hypothetical protein
MNFFTSLAFTALAVSMAITPVFASDDITLSWFPNEITFLKDFELTEENSVSINEINTRRYGGKACGREYTLTRTPEGITELRRYNRLGEYVDVQYPTNMELKFRGKQFKLLEVIESCLRITDTNNKLYSGFLMRFVDEKGNVYLTTNEQIEPIVELNFNKTVTAYDRKQCDSYLVLGRTFARRCSIHSAIQEAVNKCADAGGSYEKELNVLGVDNQRVFPNLNKAKRIKVDVDRSGLARNYETTVQIDCLIK